MVTPRLGTTTTSGLPGWSHGREMGYRSCRQAGELMSLSSFPEDGSKGHLQRVEAMGALYPLLFLFLNEETSPLAWKLSLGFVRRHVPLC